MDVDVLAESVALAAAREPFTLATVVWRRAPSSGRVGAKAIVRADGSVEGWLGGACAEPSMVREALDAMTDGQPRLLFLGQPDDFERRSVEGRVTVPMACESEGALEVYLEPVLPQPQIVAIGRSPAATTLVALATALGWDATLVDDDELELDGLGIGPSSAILVASQGHYDDQAIEAALATDAGYIGLVATEKRASALLALLRDRGHSDDALLRIEAPAGLDLGRIDTTEIAVAVLADLVARRAAGRLSSATPVVPAEAIDPICGMTVFTEDARYRSSRDGEDFYFCAPGCKATFDRDLASAHQSTDTG